MALDLDEFDSDSEEIRGDIPATVTYNSVAYSSGMVSTAPKSRNMEDAGYLVQIDMVWVINNSAFAAVTAPDVNNLVTIDGVSYRIETREPYRMAADTRYGLKRQN